MTPWPATQQAPLSLTISQSLLKFMSFALVTSCSHLILWCRLLLLSSIFPRIRDFSNKSVVCIRWWKYWIFSLSISPFNKYSGLISLKYDLFDLLAFQGLSGVFSGFNSLVFCLVYLPVLTIYVTTGRTIALTIWTFADRVMPLLFNTLSRFVIAFLPRSNHHLISWLQFLVAKIVLVFSTTMKSKYVKW